MKSVGLFCLALAFAHAAFAAEHTKAEFGGNCALALSEGALFKTNCAVNEVYKGKTYCFFNQGAKEEFLKNPDETLHKVNMFLEKDSKQ